MKPWLVSASFLLCLPILGQPAPQKIAFEVASIKPSEPSPMGRVRIGMNVDASMLRYTNVSLKDCIRTAYRVKDFQVQGPDWLDDQRFDIVAKLPDGASQDQIPEMLQSLLAERFKLSLHKDTKEHNIYALVAGKGGPKLKPAEIQTPEPGPGGPQGAPGGPGGPGGPRRNMMIMMGPDGAHLKSPSATLSVLAEMLSRFTERPVVDMTGIQGQYDFDLVFAPETMRNMPMMRGGPMPPPPGAGEHPPAEPAGSIYDSVQRYGLKLEPRKAPMEILVVDRIEKMPTEN